MPIRVYTIKTTSEETIIAFGSVFLGFFASEVMSIGIVEPWQAKLITAIAMKSPMKPPLKYPSEVGLTASRFTSGSPTAI